jgi:hypothetical protein
LQSAVQVYKLTARAFFVGRVRVFFRTNDGHAKKGAFELPHGPFKKQRWKPANIFQKVHSGMHNKQ